MLNDAIDLSQVRRALVIKLRHHGDVLLSSPVMTVLKKHAPHIEIDALVYHDTQEMITQHPAVSEVFTVDRNWKKRGVLVQCREEWLLLRRLKARGYDLVVALNDHNRVALVTRWLGARWSVAPQLSWHGRFFRKSFTHLHARVPGNTRHTVAAHLDALRRLGIYPDVDEQSLVLEPGPIARSRIQAILAEQGLSGDAFTVVHPGSRWFFKCWPPERMAGLIDRLPVSCGVVVLTGAPSLEEKKMAVEILDRVNRPVLNLVGKLSLKELAALIGKAKLFVGVDSVPMHMAAAMQTPSVTLFGPTLDQVWGPWMSPHKLVMLDMPCRPCDRRGCGGGERSDCIEQIPVEQVLGAVRELMEETV